MYLENSLPDGVCVGEVGSQCSLGRGDSRHSSYTKGEIENPKVGNYFFFLCRATTGLLKGVGGGEGGSHNWALASRDGAGESFVTI